MMSQKPSAEVIQIHSKADALRYGDRWAAYAFRLENMLALAQAKFEASETLLRLAEEERDRLRRMIGS